MYLAGRQVRWQRWRTFTGYLDMWQLYAPVILAFVHSHGKHLGERMFHALGPIVTVGVVGNRVNRVDTQTVVRSTRLHLGAALSAIFGRETLGNAPLACILIGEYAYSALGVKLGCSDTVHRGLSAETIKEK